MQFHDMPGFFRRVCVFFGRRLFCLGVDADVSYSTRACPVRCGPTDRVAVASLEIDRIVG